MEKTKLTKKDIAIIEKETVFSVTDNGDSYEFSWYTDAGEDFSFEVEKGENVIEQVKDYYYNFDAEEHALSWVGGNGAPDLFTLCDDAKEIQRQLGTLANVVEELGRSK